MEITELVFETNKLLTLQSSIENLCLTCEGLATVCNSCPTNNAMDLLVNIPNQTESLSKKTYDLLTQVKEIAFQDLVFEKNTILLTQNAIEAICEDCKGIGLLCRVCNIHKVRRTIASLPVIDNTPSFSKKKEKNTEAKSCGTSCSTGGCGTKK